MANANASKGASTTGTSTATATETAKRRRGLSAESRLKLALNDVISVATENGGEGSEEVKQASALLTSLGFTPRPSAAKEIARLQEELQSIDITAPDSQTRINEISKSIGKLRSI